MRTVRRRHGRRLTLLLLSVACVACDASSTESRRASAATPTRVRSAAPITSSASMLPSVVTAASSADAGALVSLGVAKPLGDGFVHFDDANLKHSQAPLVAVIVPAAHADRFYRAWLGTSARYWTPTPEDVSALNGARDQVERAQPSISRRILHYRFQVLGIVDAGQRHLFVNAFCGEHDGWLREPVAVDDGGDCYFNFRYDLAAKKIAKLTVNGEG